MSRSLSSAAVRAALARETNEVFVALAMIEHPSLDEPIRICTDSAPVVRSDGTFLPYPFEFILPEDTDGELPRAAVRVDNVDREVLRRISSVTGRPDVTFMLVLASQPDLVEYGPVQFQMGEASWDQMVLNAALAYQEDIWMQAVPSQQYTPSNSPGLFR